MWALGIKIKFIVLLVIDRLKFKTQTFNNLVILFLLEGNLSILHENSEYEKYIKFSLTMCILCILCGICQHKSFADTSSVVSY